MKIHAFIACFSLFALTAAVQAGGSSWETDFAKAQETAKEAGKYMLLDFTGSDWCGWCIRLNKEVFNKKEFKTYADANLVLVELDFPRRKKTSKELREQNEALMRKYKVRGFPTIVVLSPDGETAGVTGYQAGGPEKYVEHVEQIIAAHKARREIKEKVQ